MTSTLPWTSTARTASSVSTSPTSSTWSGWRRRWRSARLFLKKAARKKLKTSAWRSTKHFARWVPNAQIFWRESSNAHQNFNTRWIYSGVKVLMKPTRRCHKTGNWKCSSKWNRFSCELAAPPLNWVKQGHFYAQTHGDGLDLASDQEIKGLAEVGFYKLHSQIWSSQHCLASYFVFCLVLNCHWYFFGVNVGQKSCHHEAKKFCPAAPVHWWSSGQV